MPSVFLPKSNASKSILSATSSSNPKWLAGGSKAHNSTTIKAEIDTLIDEAKNINLAGGAKKKHSSKKRSSKKRSSKKGKKRSQKGGDMDMPEDYIMDGGAKKKKGSSKKRSSKKGKKRSMKGGNISSEAGCGDNYQEGGKKKRSTKKSSKKRSTKKGSKKRSQKGGRELPAALVKYQAIVKKVKEDLEKSGVVVKGVTVINKYVGEYNKMGKEQDVPDIEKFIMSKYEEDKKKGVIKKKFEEIEKQINANRAAKKAAKKAAKAQGATVSESSDSM